MRKVILRLCAGLLCLCLLLPLASCAFFRKEKTDTAPFTIAEGGEATCRIVYPTGGNTWRGLAGLLGEAIRRLTGVSVEAVSDAESDAPGDILLGKTNRALSAAAEKTLEGQETAFAFVVADRRLAVAATDAKAASLAIAYFEMQCTGALGGTAGEGELSLPYDLSLTRAVATDTAEPAELLEKAATMRLSAGTAFSIAANKNGGRVLAAAAVADKLYTAQTDGGGTVLVAYSTAKGKLLAKGEKLSVTGVAGMCYNPVLGLLTLVDETGKLLHLADPETLSVCRTVTLSTAVNAIAYDTANLCYVMRSKAADGTFFCLDNACRKTGGKLSEGAYGDQVFAGTVLAGGTEADGSNLYLLYSVQTKEANAALVALARDGGTRLIATFSLPSGTPVALTRSGRVFYAVTAGETGSTVTKLTLPLTQPVPEEPFTLFDGKNTEMEDSSYVSSEFLFDVYAFVKNEYARNGVLQGACTDGTYGYFFAEYQGGAGNYSNSETHDTVIVKVDMETGELVKYSKPLPLGHSNDGCYNPHTGQLVISYCGQNGKTGEYLGTRAVFVDPETLEITGEIDAEVGFYAISYNADTGQYIVGRSGINFAVLDENFRVVRKVSVTGFSTEETLITQGIDTDSRYVYFVLGVVLGGGAWRNYLVVFDYEGNHVFTKTIPDVPREVENIFHIGKDIYVSYNGYNGKTPYKPCHKLHIEQ